MKDISLKENRDPAIQEVKAVMKDTRDLKMFKWYQAILMHLKGQTYEEIASLIGCTSVAP